MVIEKPRKLKIYFNYSYPIADRVYLVAEYFYRVEHDKNSGIVAYATIKATVIPPRILAS